MEGQNFFVYSIENEGNKMFVQVLFSYTYNNKQVRTAYGIFMNS